MIIYETNIDADPGDQFIEICRRKSDDPYCQGCARYLILDLSEYNREGRSFIFEVIDGNFNCMLLESKRRIRYCNMRTLSMEIKNGAIIPL